MDFKLYPYQVEGVRLLERFNGRGLLGDQPGLGKTIQVLTYWAKYRSSLPAIVVCPASVKWQWKSEAKRVGLRAVVLERFSERRLPKGADVYIVNYDILSDRQISKRKGIRKGRLDALLEIKPNAIGLDEGHYIANPGSKRTRAVKKLCKRIQRIVVATGTPMRKRPMDLFTCLNLLWPKDFPSRWSFGKAHCGPRWTPWGWQYNGATRLKELHRKLKSCFLYGCLVLSDRGLLPIGEIVENELPIKVLSWNTKTSQVQWKPIKAFFQRRETGPMVRIKHEFGELVCTPDHQVWTEQGWKRAKSLVAGMSLSILPQDISKKQTNAKSGPVLLRKMCGGK